MQFWGYGCFTQIRQRIFNCTDMQIMNFILDKILKLLNITRLSIISHCKVVLSKIQSVFWPTLYLIIMMMMFADDVKR